MKRVLIIVGSIVVLFSLLVLGIVGVAFRATAALPDAAERFFAAVRTDDMAAASAELSEGFRAASDEAAIRRFIASRKLADVEDLSWDHRSISGDRGQLRGTATTASGGAVPLTLHFVKERDGWKIHSMATPPAGVATADEGRLAPPPIEEQTALTRRTMHDFAVSLEEDDMQHFHGSLSSLWQSQVTPEELEGVFSAYFENDIGLLALDGMQPQFDRPAEVDEDGVLELTGHYLAGDQRLSFEHRYVYEGTDWRLIGINLQLH